MLPLPLQAQRDYILVSQRNPWVASGCAAALTTYADSSIATGSLRYRYEAGPLRGRLEGASLAAANMGRREQTFQATAASYYRLHPRVVTYGAIDYQHFAGTEMSGSALAQAREVQHLLPFDMVEASPSNPGRKVAETVKLTGAVGWNVWNRLSLGTRLHYEAGHYAKQKDLRHENALMQLHADADAFWQFRAGQPWGVSAGFRYERQSESVAFSIYGTTDRVYQTLIDYANGLGIVETYSGSTGYTDKAEQPLYSDGKGMHLGALFPLMGGRQHLFVEGHHAWREGYYGRISQYTIQHLSFEGKTSGLHLRYTLSAEVADSHRPLHWVEARWKHEHLQAYRHNYQETKKDGVSSYTYYSPAQMSDKTLTHALLGYVGYWHRLRPDLYTWEVRGGTELWQHRETAYRFPEQLTREQRHWRPYLKARYNWLAGSRASLVQQRSPLSQPQTLLSQSQSSLSQQDTLRPQASPSALPARWSVEAGAAYLTGDAGHEWQGEAGLCYEFPLVKWPVRPQVGLHYTLRQGQSRARHAVELSLGVAL